ncbi:MAG: hypothetical protein JXR10_07755 [Cyclobacteriaceae bacterium]
MNLRLFALPILFLFFSVQLNAQTKYLEQAVLAAPESLRAEATIYGFDDQGDFKVFKEGTNHLICLGDDPTKDGFSVAAYHKDLEPFMARGRELKAEGKSFKEIFDIREEEVKSKMLAMPDKSTLMVANGTFDTDSSILDFNVRYVFYIPFATSESTGLPAAPMNPGGAWIMNPGTHRAHIMITPPSKD